MAASPRFKVFNPGGEYRAAFKDATEAAAFVGAMGDGWQIRGSHNARDTYWTEGREEFPASQSWDGVAEVIESRAFNN